MNTIKECFNSILRSGKEESRQAARTVRKLVYSSSAEGKEKYDDIKKIIDAAPHEYARISEDWRQENFAMAVSVIYFLHDRESQPDFLFPWLFQLLQHQNGYIRHAAVKMITHEIGPLTMHIRFPGEKSYTQELKPERADSILRSLSASLNGLLSALWEPKYKRYKHINFLPPSPYKSVQMVVAELEELCEENYMDRSDTDGAAYPNMKIKTKEQILQKRKEIEQELSEMLKETKSDFGLSDIKEIIYNEDGQDSLTDIISMFDIGQDAAEFENVLELVNDAWNYFPHKIIGGISPAEKLLEYHQQHG